MNIAIIGLGLIGGSYAKSISKFTSHDVYAISHNQKSIDRALIDGAIIRSIDEEELSSMDLTIVCLPPKLTIDFINKNINNFKGGSILTDVCGIKTAIYDGISSSLKGKNISYISMHPMAGRECSGYFSSLSDLFIGHSLILIDDNNKKKDIKILENLNYALGFSQIVHTTRENHDKIIAYTSQMCHITSNAFVKSPTAKMHDGFSGGSFEDLTRVAFLDPKLWTQLFSMNRVPLLEELTAYIDELQKYKEALENKDNDALFSLLKEGREIKISIS